MQKKHRKFIPFNFLEDLFFSDLNKKNKTSDNKDIPKIKSDTLVKKYSLNQLLTQFKF